MAQTKMIGPQERRGNIAEISDKRETSPTQLRGFEDAKFGPIKVGWRRQLSAPRREEGRSQREANIEIPARLR